MIEGFLAFYLIGFILACTAAFQGSIENFCAIAAHQRGRPLATWMLIIGFLFAWLMWFPMGLSFVAGLFGARR